jgi:iron complex transport system substrate-binding protein
VVERVALALGDAAAGPALWRQLVQRIDAAAARVPARWRGQSVYFEVASVPFAAGEASFIGELLARLGLATSCRRRWGRFRS